MSEPVAWVDGVLRPFSTAAVPVWDLGVVAGAAITEMARTYRHQPFRLPQHFRRLLQSCRTLNFPVAWSPESLLDAAAQVLEVNSRLIAEDQDLGIVAFITAGTNPTYLGGQGSQQGTTAIHTFPLPFVLWRDGLQNGVRLRIPSIRQVPENCLPVEHKIRNRLHWWLADREAQQLETGSRALLLDQQDCVTETSTSCFYAVRHGEVISPARQVLDSMSRRVVQQLLAELGVPFRCEAIPAAQLADISEAFLSSTPVGLLPVSRIDGRPVGDGRPGPLFRQLLTRWSHLVGLDMEQQILGQASPG